MDFDRMRVELSRKVGPLPLGAWLAIAAVGVAAAIVIRRRRAAATSAEPAVVGPDGERLDATAVASYRPGGFVVGGGATQATGSTGAPGDAFVAPNTPDPLTNSDWGRAASNYLIGKGYEPTIVVDGISRFLGGQTLTTQQQAMMNDALRNIGPTPENVPPPAVTPVPVPTGSGGGGGSVTPKPTANPAPVKPASSGDMVITVKPGQTLWSIAQQFRAGGTIQAAQARIARYNGITLGPAPAFTPSPWRVGQQVRIPGPGVAV